ncbi:MAG: diacylglycerol/lipid kinase family protein [Chloroflexota bacterium]
MPRASVVMSPVAGTAVSREDLLEQLAPLTAAGWQVRVAVTTRAGEAVELARAAAAAGEDVVVAAGGDGTVNEVLQGIAGSESALAVLPLGTGNVWAHEIGVPTDLAGAVQVLLHGRLRRVDVGRAGERYFLLMAGVGFDAEVTRQTDKQTKRRFGRLAYLIAGVKVALGIVGHRVEINLDGVPRGARALMVVIGNSRNYGGQVSLTSDARLDDGLLDVVVFKGTSVLHAAWYALSVLLRRHRQDQGVEYYRAKRLVISSVTPLPVQVDGDVIGETPMSFQVRPLALKVVMPQAARPDLFDADDAEARGEAPTGE